MYIPSLEFGVADGIYDIIDGIVGDIYKQASMIKRLATHSGQDHYQVSCCSYRVAQNVRPLSLLVYIFKKGRRENASMRLCIMRLWPDNLLPVFLKKSYSALWVS